MKRLRFGSLAITVSMADAADSGARDAGPPVAPPAAFPRSSGPGEPWPPPPWSVPPASLRRLRLAAYPVALALLLGPAVARAQIAAAGNPGSVLDGIVRQFQQGSAGWPGTLNNLSLGTFGLLAVLELAVSLAKLLPKQPDMSDITAELINRTLFVGFFAFLEQTWTRIAGWIIDSWRLAGQMAVGTQMLFPSDVFNAGMKVASDVASEMGLLTPGTDVGLALVAVIVCFSFALIAMEIIVLLCESLIVTRAAFIFLGFGANRYTHDIAIGALRYCFGVGAKLFVVELLSGIGMGIIRDMTTNLPHVTFTDGLTIAGASIVLFGLVKTVPASFGRIAGNVSTASHADFVRATAELAAAATALTATAAGGMGAVAGTGTSLGMVSYQAGKAGTAGLTAATGAGTAPTSALGRAGAVVGNMGRAVGSSLASDISRTLTGGNRAGSYRMARMAEDMRNATRLLREDAERASKGEGGIP